MFSNILSSSPPTEPMVLGSPSSGHLSPSSRPSYIQGYLFGNPTAATIGSPEFYRQQSSSAQFGQPNTYGFMSPPGNEPTRVLSNAQQGDRRDPFVVQSSFHAPFESSQPFIVTASKTPKAQGGIPTKSIVQDFVGSRDRGFIPNLNTPHKQTGVGIPSSPDSSNFSSSFVAPSTARSPHRTFTPAERQPLSARQVDPLYSHGDNLDPSVDLDERWVTIFGFPKDAAMYILEQFGQYGTILDYEIASEGNWMHVHYQSKLQARRALGKSTKIFNNSIQVGVTPCVDTHIIAKYRDSVAESSTVTDKSTVRPLRSYAVEDLNTTTRSTMNLSMSDLLDSPKRERRMRSLVAPSPVSKDKIWQTQEPSGGLISRAFKSVLGW